MASDMSKPRYPEHQIHGDPPETIELCARCRSMVVVYLGAGDGSLYVPSERRPSPWCYRCGEEAKGIRYCLHEDPL